MGKEGGQPAAPPASQRDRAYLEWGWVGNGSAVSHTGLALPPPSRQLARLKELLPAGASAHAGKGSPKCQEREPGSQALATACGCRFLTTARASHVSSRPKRHHLGTILDAGHAATSQPWTPSPRPAPAPTTDPVVLSQSSSQLQLVFPTLRRRNAGGTPESQEGTSNLVSVPGAGGDAPSAGCGAGGSQPSSSLFARRADSLQMGLAVACYK